MYVIFEHVSDSRESNNPKPRNIFTKIFFYFRSNNQNNFLSLNFQVLTFVANISDAKHTIF